MVDKSNRYPRPLGVLVMNYQQRKHKAPFHVYYLIEIDFSPKGSKVPDWKMQGRCFNAANVRSEFLFLQRVYQVDRDRIRVREARPISAGMSLLSEYATATLTPVEPEEV